MNVYDKHSRMENIVFKSITIFGTMYVVNVIEIDKYCRINTHTQGICYSIPKNDLKSDEQ